MTSQYFAQVKNGVVTKIAVVNSDFLAANPERYEGEWIETFIDVAGKTYAGIGYTYNAENDNFTAPEIEAV